MTAETVAAHVADNGSLETEVRSLVERVVTLSEERRRTDIAQWLRAQLSVRRGEAATVVLVGETKRGKSSLLNALLGCDVSPVQADVATNVYVVVRHAARPVTLVHRTAAERPAAIRLDEVAKWATVEGNPGNSKEVRGVEIGIDHPLLAQGLQLVDTPGVGGLSAAHSEVTLAALSRADALVFVVDSDAPLSRPEFAFLARATRRVATVLFVLTKIDTYDGWEAILETDRELLRAHAPQLAHAPFYPVSSQEKAEADASGDDELARESGIPALQAALVERVAGRARTLSLTNLVHATREAVARLDAVERAQVEVADDDSALRHALEEAEVLQSEHATRTQGWENTVSLEVQRRIRHSLDREFRRRLLDLSIRYEARIRSADRRLGTIPEDLNAELHAIAADLQTMLVTATAELVVDLSDQFHLSGGSPVSERLAAGAAPLELGALGRDETTRRGGELSQKLRGLTLLIGGASSGRLLATLLPGGLLLGAGVGVLAGAVAWGSAEWLRRRVHDEQEALAVLRRALDTARVEIDADLRDRLLDAQRLVRDELGDRIGQRRRELAELADRHRASALAGRPHQARARAEAGRRLAETGVLRETIRDLQAAVTI